MSPKFAFDMDAALGDLRPSYLFHQSTGLPTSLAERYLSELFSSKYIPRPADGEDEDGFSLPLPIVERKHLARFTSDTRGKRIISGIVAPTHAEIRSSRIFKALKCLDHSLILMEKTTHGYAVLPVALFEHPDRAPKEGEVYADMAIYADAMRRLPRAHISYDSDMLLRAPMDRVVPHWLSFENNGNLADKTRETYDRLREYFALRIATIAPPGSRLFCVFIGGRIHRDGTTSEGRISLGVTAPYRPLQLDDLEEEFARLMNHERLAPERPYIAVTSVQKGITASSQRVSVYSESTQLPDEPPSAHDLIEAECRAQPWLNPSC